MRIYDYTDYKKYIKARIENAKAAKTGLNYAKLAKAMQVQRSFLSQILAGKCAPNSDQMFTAGEALGLNEHEMDYLLLLVEIERCQNPKRQQILSKRLDQIRHSETSTQAYLQNNAMVITESDLERYFIDPYNALVHMLLTISDFRKDTALITKSLHISRSRLEGILAALEQCGIIKIDKEGIKITKKLLHLPRSSSFTPAHGTFFRAIANDELCRRRDDKGYFFTSTFSATETEREEIRLAFLDLIERISGKIAKAPEKNVFHMNFDLFKLV